MTEEGRFEPHRKLVEVEIVRPHGERRLPGRRDSDLRLCVEMEPLSRCGDFSLTIRRIRGDDEATELHWRRGTGDIRRALQTVELDRIDDQCRRPCRQR
jgi:hypothetical protein